MITGGNFEAGRTLGHRRQHHVPHHGWVDAGPAPFVPATWAERWLPWTRARAQRRWAAAATCEFLASARVYRTPDTAHQIISRGGQP